MPVNVTFPGLLPAFDVALLLLRLMVAAVFVTSGINHLKDPVGRAKSIEASPPFTAVLGAGETLGGLGVATGVLVQPADGCVLGGGKSPSATPDTPRSTGCSGDGGGSEPRRGELTPPEPPRVAEQPDTAEVTA